MSTFPTWRNASLEAAIAATPNADAPYLVYADWFEERGETRRAKALRVLGGVMDESADGVDAGRLVLALETWLNPDAAPEDFEWESFTAPSSPGQLRAARRGQHLPLFLSVWGESSPFTPDDSLCTALAANETIHEAPLGARLEEVSFEHVPVNQNGTIGVSGAVLWATCPATAAFDVLAARLTGQDIEDLRGQPRLDAFEDATDWLAMSRAQAYGTLFSSLAGNAGHGVRRGDTEVELGALLAELGALQAAMVSQTEFIWQVMQFERGWLAFYVTF